MSENFAVEIISPNQSVLKSETKEVTLPSFEGEMGILKDHTSLITFLRPGIITIKKDTEEKKFFVWTHSGKKKTNLSPLKLAKVYQDLGAGEVMINNIDRDGLMRGYD